MPTLYNAVWSCWVFCSTLSRDCLLACRLWLRPDKEFDPWGWVVGRVREWKSRTEEEEKRERDEGGRREWVNRLRKKGGVSRREDKNDPIDRLHPGLRIDEHLSQASVISPTNHAVTSAAQYHTLQAPSSHTPTPLWLYAQLNRASTPSWTHKSGC